MPRRLPSRHLSRLLLVVSSLLATCHLSSAFSTIHSPTRLHTSSRWHTPAAVPLRASVATDVESAYDPNGIHPKTMTLPGSVRFFALFVIKLMNENQRRRHLLRLRKGTGKAWQRWRKNWIALNEQRRNLVQLADYSWSIVAPSFFFLIMGALMTSIIPHYYSRCFQLVATLEGPSPRAYRALIGLAVTGTLGAFFTGCRGSLFWIAGSRANYNVRVKLHRNLLLQEAAFYDNNEVGYLLSRLNSDVNKIGQVISYHVNVVCRQLAQFIFGSVYLVRISPMLSLWTFGGIALVAWISAIYGAFNRELAQRVQDTFADATAVAETSFSMSETIRAFDGVKVESAKYEHAQSKALDLEEVQAWGYGTHKFISDALQENLDVLLIFACWTIGRAGGLAAEKLTTFLFYAHFVLESSNEVGDQWAKIQGAVGASSSVFSLIQRIPRIRDPLLKSRKTSETVSTESTNGSVNGKASIYAPPKLNGSTPRTPIISISNMTLMYDKMEIPACDQVDMTIYQGDRVAVVGRSGSGKSTLLRSILRFYDPSTGEIRLGDTSLTHLPRSSLAERVSIVAQEPALFPMPLIDNVLYGIDRDVVDEASGKTSYSELYRDKAATALRLAGLTVEPGNDLNLELDTRVGEGGRSLSGGQRQRVAIARALVRNPEVLLLDEPTAALDSQSEKAVVEALQRAMEYTKSMVMVTHRLGVIRSLHVNRVIVMERGKVVESGPPEELLRKPNGLYAGLAREQGITCAEVSTAAIDKYLHQHDHHHDSDTC